MEATEFHAKMDALFAEHGVPEVVSYFISVNAYDRGHSAGYEEVYNIAVGLVYDMAEIINAVGRRSR